MSKKQLPSDFEHFRKFPLSHQEHPPPKVLDLGISPIVTQYLMRSTNRKFLVYWVRGCAVLTFNAETLLDLLISDQTAYFHSLAWKPTKDLIDYSFYAQWLHFHVDLHSSMLEADKV